MRIGTILHGALGDVYEQALAFSLLRDRYRQCKLIAFFSREDRLKAFQHFVLDMFDEVHLWKHIPNAEIDRFDQFQVHDGELNEDVLSNLPERDRKNFDMSANWLPWVVLRDHLVSGQQVRLALSSEGQEHYHRLLDHYGLDENSLQSNCVGYLWRYRAPNGAVKPWFQAAKARVLATKSELMEILTSEYGLHIVVAGMNANHASGTSEIAVTRQKSGVLAGEINAKYTSDVLTIPEGQATYMQGLGYAAELEIMAKTRFQIMMPSGFSEPIWLMNGRRALLVDSPPVYLLKLLKYRMPLFDNRQPGSFIFNNRRCHKPQTVMNELKKRMLL